MPREEILKELQMTYYELQEYLLGKYGAAQSDYFASPDCRRKNEKVTRTQEGLYCHHMDEDKGANLSNPNAAKIHPYEWQKKERLVYCNIIEHLILHIKIAILRQRKRLSKPEDVETFFTTGGVFAICCNINEMFEKNENHVGWRKACFCKVKENYRDYIALLKAVVKYIDRYYYGEKRSGFIRVGSYVHFSDCDCEILKITKTKDKLLLKLPTGAEKVFDSHIASSQFEYTDYVDIALGRMAGKNEGFCESIYRDLKMNEQQETVDEYARALRIDYSGYGYSQYTNIQLSTAFGAANADEYIANAFPVYYEMAGNIKNKTPRFWKGPDIPDVAKDRFYIVRIEAMFEIKEGMEPFVRCKKHDFLRNEKTIQLDAQNNFLKQGGSILATSDVYDRKTNRYYSKFRDCSGKIVDAVVELTLGREDYQLFKERYNVRYLKILDGCYFVENY